MWPQLTLKPYCSLPPYPCIPLQPDGSSAAPDTRIAYFFILVQAPTAMKVQTLKKRRLPGPLGLSSLLKAAIAFVSTSNASLECISMHLTLCVCVCVCVCEEERQEEREREKDLQAHLQSRHWIFQWPALPPTAARGVI